VSRWEPASPGDGQWKSLKRKRKAARKAKVVAVKRKRSARKHLATFWRKVQGLPRQDKLAMLKRMATIEAGRPTSGELSDKRGRFDDKKWMVDLRGAACFVCGQAGHHRHHVIALGKGGHNGHDNIVVLCEWCHQDIHPFMAPKGEIDLERELERAAVAMGLAPKGE